MNLYFEETTNGGSRTGVITMKNIGKGPAYNISIERFKVAGHLYNFYLENRLLEINQEVRVKHAVKRPDGGTEFDAGDLMWFLVRLVPQSLHTEAVEFARNNPAFFIITYQGTNGENYHSIFALHCDLPPIDTLYMRFLAHGKGKAIMGDANKLWDKTVRIKSPFER